MKTSEENLSEAVAHSFMNREEIERSTSCACFHCLARFAPSEILLWTDSDDPNDDDPGALRDDSAQFHGRTAICPRCEYDSVIGSASGYDFNDAFLRLLHDHWHTREKKAQPAAGGYQLPAPEWVVEAVRKRFE